MQTRKRILQCYILSILLHAFETLTLTKNMESKRNAFEICGNRLMLRNIKPMNKFYRWQNKARSLLPTTKKRKKKCYQKPKLKGRKDGGNPELSGRKKKIKEWLGHTYNGCVVVNFLSWVIFIFPLFQLHQPTLPYSKTKRNKQQKNKKQKLPEIKKLTTTDV